MADNKRITLGQLGKALERVEEEKQDKITGVAGQFVGFDADGKPEAQNAEWMAKAAKQTVLIVNDGNVEGRESLYGFLYKVSDLVPNAEDLIGGTLTVETDSQSPATVIDITGEYIFSTASDMHAVCMEKPATEDSMPIVISVGAETASQEGISAGLYWIDLTALGGGAVPGTLECQAIAPVVLPDKFLPKNAATNAYVDKQVAATNAYVDEKVATKQDTLTGTQDQMLGFNSDGNLVAKEKMFGDLSTGGNELTWDGIGNTIDGNEVLCWYKAHSETPSMADLANGGLIVMRHRDGTEVTHTFTVDDIEDQVDNICILVGVNTTVFINKEDTEDLEKGVFFIKHITDAEIAQFGEYVSRFVINDYTGFPITKQLDKRYLPEHLQFGEHEFTKEIFPETEVTGVDDGSGHGAYEFDSSLYSAFFEVGSNSLCVIFDGAEYLCHASPIEDIEGSYIYGNASLGEMGEDTGEPFAVFSMFDPEGSSVLLALKDTLPHTISITVVGTKIEKVAEKYLPGAVLLYFDGDNYLYATEDTTDTSKRLTLSELKSIVQSGRTIYTYYNGGYLLAYYISADIGFGVVRTLSSMSALEMREYYTAEYTAE